MKIRELILCGALVAGTGVSAFQLGQENLKSKILKFNYACNLISKRYAQAAHQPVRENFDLTEYQKVGPLGHTKLVSRLEYIRRSRTFHGEDSGDHYYRGFYTVSDNMFCYDNDFDWKKIAFFGLSPELQNIKIPREDKEPYNIIFSDEERRKIEEYSTKMGRIL